MLLHLYPNCLVLTGLLTVSALRAADSAVISESVDQVSTAQASFSEFKDPYSHNSWMVAQVDFTGKAPGPEKWMNNVTVTLTMAWGEKGSSPQIETALTATINLVAIESGKRNAVFFFVSPEILGQGPHETTYEAGKVPTFYAIQYSVDGHPVSLGKLDYSTQTLPDANFVKGFLNKAGEKAQKGVLFEEATVPPYVLNAALFRLTSDGSAFPTYLQSADAGH